jgi:acyl-CoA dehydrogenase
MNAAKTENLRSLSGDELLRETAERLFTQKCTPELVREAESTPWSTDLWSLVAEAGLPWVGSGEDGSLGTILDVAEILHVCGRFAVPLPIAETGLIGGKLLAIAGLEVGEVPITVPVPHPLDRIELTRASDGWKLTAHWHHVPWAAEVQHLVTTVATDSGAEFVVVVEKPNVVRRGNSLAGEPRDEVTVDHVLSESAIAEVAEGTYALMWRLGALSRSLMSGGAMERSTEMAVGYSRERFQFGKALATFQAIQHHLAIATEYASAATLAAWVAAAAMTDDLSDPFGKVAVSRAISQEASEVVTARSHQVFGAIGMTREHDLHFRTRRCWTWAHEWGSGAHWAKKISESVLEAGPSELWPSVSAGGVR